MDNLDIKNYKDLSSDGKAARRAFSKALCTNCFLYKEGKEGKGDKLGCTPTRFKICVNAYTKGFVRGVKHHRNIIKNKKK